MGQVLTTDSVPDRDKLAYWHDALGKALVPMTVVPRGSGPFAGHIASGRVGHLRVSDIVADAQRASRTAGHVSRWPGEYIGVGVQRSGTATLVQEGRAATASQGDLLVYDTARPYSLDYPERFSTRVVHIPRTVLGLPEQEIGRVTGTVIDASDGFGAVVLSLLTTLGTSEHPYSPMVASRLAAGIADLIATLVVERTQRDAGEPATPRDHLVRRIRDHIEQHLEDPALSPENVAKAQHISVRYLHRLFEGEDVTVAKFIQRRRLEQCARELARGDETVPAVAAVSKRSGFANPAHFSRVFRSVYGVSPRDWRDARPGHPVRQSVRPVRSEPRTSTVRRGSGHAR
ncbi:helix-turn-helix domain-containing protein [Streptomyces brasiliensis]|uniref:AraC family transcriptional regulator n=1 Tax=Streptomyces brasiliensis TaxID=1954 RepID=A0A917UNK6_9ACTN|nr:helix-turn-helix domain-containing protein [Streptomyces brasiliensis]GGJ70769.1 AraC family transcriptional regulator [Streptomyces brasiliensis]